MGDGDELDVEAADLHPVALLDDRDRDLRRARLLQSADLEQSGRKLGHVDRSPSLGQSVASAPK